MKHDTDQPSNPGINRQFAQVMDEQLSRRAFIGAGAATALTFLATAPSKGMNSGDAPVLPFTFSGVPISRADQVVVPAGYQAIPLFPWGHPINGLAPAFQPDASNDAHQQSQQAGMGHDGMEWFPFPGDEPERSDRGLLVMNHEYADQGLLFKDGIASPMTAEKVRKSQAAHGISVIAVQRSRAGEWTIIDSPYSRRYTASSPMKLCGPAAGSQWVITAQDPAGDTALGTFNNCACGKTPWGTYLTCEENFHGVFGTDADEQAFQPSDDQRRYGLTASGHVGTFQGQQLSVYRWWQFDERFDLAKYPNEVHRFGYVVEIDPSDPTFVPRKHTALGRFKHENAAVAVARDGHVVVYMGDDEKNEYIYKFVTARPWNPSDRQSNRELLSEGTLYVARFHGDGTGQWLELTPGANGLTPEHGFECQADICVRTRQAADRAGATMMDRPEWVAVHPQTQQVFVTLTNNSLRGVEPPSTNPINGTGQAGTAQPPVDAANPRGNNVYGHILRWTESNNDPRATTFHWEHFLLAGDPQQDAQVSIRGDSFGSPDGLRFDQRGILWIQTDASAEMMGQMPYQNIGNNMMLAADPVSRTVRRFLTGPVGCEITGMAMTPDDRTMFVNIQHPGEPATDISDPANPQALSSWPDGAAGGRPRSCTIVIYRPDGQTIGT